MYLLYSFLLTVGLVILLPRFMLDAFRAGKYVTGLGERLGRLPRLNDSDSPLIWLHCVSVGETEAARPLVKSLKKHYPEYRLAISTTTVTGQQVARSAFARDAAAIFYFPLDFGWTVRRVLRTLRPSAVVILETELWPNLLRACHHQSIPTALVNGRISENSFRRYYWIRGFMKSVLSHLLTAIMQSEADASRIQKLGMNADQIRMFGNLKFDSAEVSQDDVASSVRLAARFGISQNQNVIVAASTHEPEELVVIDAFKSLLNSRKDRSLRLVLAPRHPERFDEVARLIDAAGVRWTRRSAVESETDKHAEVVLLDTIGELRAIYALADVAFVGGSLTPRGGHNVLEPAAQNVCVVTGPYMNNFAAVTAALLARDAIVQLPHVTDEQLATALASALDDLLDDEAKRRQIAARANEVCKENQGATDLTVQALSHLLSPTTSAPDSIPFATLKVTALK